MANRTRTPEEKIEADKALIAKLKARVQSQEARLKSEERKKDTRKKIIAGALALEHKDATFQDTLRRLLNEYVTKPQERALFDLPPLPEEPETPPS